MKWFNNLKISKKLLLGYLIVTIIAGVVGLVGVNGLNKMKASIEEIGLNRLPSIQLLEIMNEAQTAVKAAERTILSQPTASATYTKETENIENAYKRANDARETFEVLPQTEEEAALWKQFIGEWDNWKSDQEEFMKIASELQNTDPQNTEVINTLIAKLKNQSLVVTSKSFRAAEGTLTQLIDLNAELADKSNKDAAATTTTAIVTLIIVMIVGLIAAVGIGIWIASMISRPINEMVQAADKLALGEVDVNVSSESKDEVGQLAEAFGRMIENIRGQSLAAERIANGDLTIEVDIKSENDLLGKKLSEMVHNNNLVLTNIATASDQVAEGSKQVSDASITLSEGATEQASSIEELTASIEEIHSQTELNAQNASQANILAENAKLNAEQGNHHMYEMLRAMEEINGSSANISRIIKVIDNIAFQTNILALNAAVEAARAGQHGKGFSVVAEEVRNLATRSAEAAKEITEMIEGSIKKVEDGTIIAKDTAESLESIVKEIEKVAILVKGIAVASNEQTIGIGQINQGIMQVSQVVQANAATSEESAAASEELSGQAMLLKATVSKFKLKQNTNSYINYDRVNPEALRMHDNILDKSKYNSNYIEATYKDGNGITSKY